MKSKRVLATVCDKKGWSVMIKLFLLFSFVALAHGASSPVVQLTEETWSQVHFLFPTSFTFLVTVRYITARQV